MKSETEREYRERILRVLVHVQNHLDEAIDLDGLARLACFSPFHFHRIFRGMVGEPVKEHVRRLRLERAACRLKLSQESVTRLAFDAGYETHEAFTRAFSAHFGEPPSRYREAHQLAPMPDAPSGVTFDPDHLAEHFRPLGLGVGTMDVRLEKVSPMRVAFIRHVGPYQEVGQTWQRLCSWAGPRGLFGPNTMMLGISHDDPDVTPPDKLRYDACIVVGDHIAAEGDVGVQTIAGGQYAVATHRGPYERLGETYAAFLGRWMPANNHVPMQSPPFEVYRNSPMNTPPDGLITDIYAQIGPA